MDKVYYGNILDKIGKEECIICITSNGSIRKDGTAVMGRGIGKEISKMYPDLPKILGEKIKEDGNVISALKKVKNTLIVSFPVKPCYDIANKNVDNVVEHKRKNFKPGDRVPGWACKASIDIIRKSMRTLSSFVFNTGIKAYLPKPGCGSDGLKWEDVKEAIKYCKANKIIICDFPNKEK